MCDKTSTRYEIFIRNAPESGCRKITYSADLAKQGQLTDCRLSRSVNVTSSR
jgi:hypothetical protein